MTAIAELPNLEVLKLQCYAFRGPKWETYERDFSQLEFLLLEETDLEDCLFGTAEKQQSSGNDVLQVCVKSSADERKRKS
ncbi:UNVERIFIED_CONTAM: hypothetical protein Sindi_0353800 [Sesamum indicum]